MNASKTKAFYYHADASALGGVLDYPVQQTVSVAGSVSLAPAGGSNSLQLDAFRSLGGLSLRSAQVSASGTEHEGSGWRTVVTAIIEGLNILRSGHCGPAGDGRSFRCCIPATRARRWSPLNGTKFENLQPERRADSARHPEPSVC